MNSAHRWVAIATGTLASLAFTRLLFLSYPPGKWQQLSKRTRICP